MRDRLLPWVALVTVWILWGSTYLGIRYAIETIPPLLAAGARFLIAGLLMFAVVGPRHARGAQRPTWPHLRSAAIIGGLLLVGGNGLVSLGEQHLDSGFAALIVATVPVWMVLINALVTRTRVSGPVLFALLLGTVGIGVLVGGPGGDVHAGGTVMVLIACVLWAAGSVYARTAPLPRHPLVVASLEMITAGVALLVLAALRGEFGRLHVADISTASWLGLTWLVFAGSIVAFSAYLYVNSVLPNDTVATYAYVNPVIAVLLGAAIAGESVGLNVYLGGAVIVASVALIVATRSREPRPTTPTSRSTVTEGTGTAAADIPKPAEGPAKVEPAR
ncbi:EamA family transporter [Embleya scabrispora]|uniref:EamA family transporter n=1 Tax=Embleya scabrispora TaxID=159449 RepID=UPI0003A6AEB1|nr:EamA family transporter [Embleya scabrispora]MYS86003.1 EamA family transporter [Streptomyces sp. SID5474]